MFVLNNFVYLIIVFHSYKFFKLVSRLFLIGGFLYLYSMIDNILNRIKSITESNLYNWVEEYIEANKSRLVTDIQNRLKRGDSVHDVNDVIGEYKSVAYRMFKQRMNPLAGGSVDLFLTGDLQRFLTIEKRSKNIFKIYSKDDKYKMLANKYGKEQFGLTEEQNTELMINIHTYLIEKIFEKILK